MSCGKVRIGVLGCSAFARRAMIPAIRETEGMELRAVASRSADKARACAGQFGCEAAQGYDELLERDDVDAVYVPLPPGLHAAWISRCLDAGKHVLAEKPFVTDEAAAVELLAKARRRGRLVMENILFPYHSQYAWVQEQIGADELGPVRLFRSTFTIPALEGDNFRYQPALGGGAMLDLGPYMVRFVRCFLGERARLLSATVRHDPSRGTDVFGAACFVNPAGQAAQVSFGFDTHYQCVWEFLGERGKLTVDRAYTPPPGFAPPVRIERPNRREELLLPADNHYRNICRVFTRTILDSRRFEPYWDEVQNQARVLEQLRTRAVSQ